MLVCLGARDLAVCSQVCTAWRRLACDDDLWQAHAELWDVGDVEEGAAKRCAAAAAAAARKSGAASGSSTESLAAAASLAAREGAIHQQRRQAARGAVSLMAALAADLIMAQVAAAAGGSLADLLGGPTAVDCDTTAVAARAAATAAAALARPRPPLKRLVGRQVVLRNNLRYGRYAEQHVHEHSANVECVAFVDHPELGLLLVSAGWDGAVNVFAMMDDFSAGGGSIGTGGSGGTGISCLHRYRGGSGWVTGLAAGRTRLVTSSTDRRIAAWRLGQREPSPCCVIAQPAEATAVRFARLDDEARVVCGCLDGAARLWCLDSAQLLAVFKGHSDVVWGLQTLPMADLLVTCSRDGLAKVWRLPPPPPPPDDTTTSGTAAAPPASSSAMAAAAASAQQHTHSSDDDHRQALSAITALSTLSGHSSAVLCMDSTTTVVSAAGAGGGPIGPLVATGSADHTIRVFSLADPAAPVCVSTLTGHTHGCLSVRFGYLPGPEGRVTLETTPAAGNTAFSSTSDAAARPAGSAAGGSASRAVAGCRCRQRLVLVSGSMGEVRLWEPLNGACLAVLRDHRGPVTCLALFHDYLVTVAMNDGACMYLCHGLGGDGGATDGRARQLPQHTENVTANGAAASGGGGSSTGAEGGSIVARRLRARVAAASQQRGCGDSATGPLEAVLCMQDPQHRAFGAALAAHGACGRLVIGTATGSLLCLNYSAYQGPNDAGSRLTAAA